MYKAKKNVSSSIVSGFNQSKEIQKMTSSFEQYNLNFSERLAFGKDKLAQRKCTLRKTKSVTKKQHIKDMNILMQNINHLLVSFLF